MTQQVMILTTSWNDGHPLDYELADLLDQYGIPATFYVPRDSGRHTIDERCIRQLAERFEVGAQTIDNVTLTHLMPSQARQEIVDSKHWLESVTGKECRMFCYPGGKFTPIHAGMVRDAGFYGTRTVEFMSTDFPRFRHGLYEMPTTIHVYPHQPQHYLRNAAKRLLLRNLWLYVRSGWDLDWDELTRLFWTTCSTRGGVFHLWGRSWEIEEHEQWARLEDIFRFFGTFSEIERKMTNAEVCDVVAARRTGRPPDW